MGRDTFIAQIFIQGLFCIGVGHEYWLWEPQARPWLGKVQLVRGSGEAVQDWADVVLSIYLNPFPMYFLSCVNCPSL